VSFSTFNFNRKQMTGKELAQKVSAQYGTTDVLAIAEQAGVPIIYQKWQPTTIGEFDKKTKTIYINLNAPIEKEVIIAHELGHYFLNEMGVKYTKKIEESVVEAFVKYWNIKKKDSIR
jgi:Zn-dependent peptidase ImmA (M78 family)